MERMTPESVLGIHEKFLIYGDPGTGKTHLALSAPEPIYAVGVRGHNEFKTRYSKSFIEKIGAREIYFDAIRDERGPRGEILDNPKGLDILKNTVEASLEQADKEGIRLKSIVMDNATQLETYMMDKAIAAEFAITGGGDKTVLVKEREWGIRKPHDTTYAGAQSLMDQFVSWLFDMPYHIVFVAHERKEFTRKEGTRVQELLKIEPQFVGQQRISIPNIFDNVWRTTVSGGGRGRIYSIQPEGDAKITAKTRVKGILNPDNERDVNLTTFINEIIEYGDELREENDA